ncbi:MAG: site-2 protease family protein [Candidatus Omnitrophica bacterium]|nr:site-2 protease family protein [Candidatus Omnitrophota bacterium]
MGLTSLLFTHPLIFFLLVFLLLYSVIAHEVAHGLTALVFGDKTAKNAGRLSLNPLVHLDPLGTISLFLVGFGWARPVPVNYGALKKSRLAFIAVSLAGVLSNILIAAAALFLLKFHSIDQETPLSMALLIAARINIILGAFNLIPIPPLDGSKVVMGFLPEAAQAGFVKLEPYGFLIILVLLYTGVLHPLIREIQQMLYALIT